MAGNSDPLTPRAKLAVTAGKAVAAASRAAGRGSGSVIGGRVALKLDPDLLARLAQNLDVVLVSATNGKTTTTRLIAEALRAAGPVVSNALGANMPAGITSALAGRLGRQVRRSSRSTRSTSPVSPGTPTPSASRCSTSPATSSTAPPRPACSPRTGARAWPVPRPSSSPTRRPAGRVGRLLLPERDLGRRRADVEGRRLVLPVLRRCDAAPRRRLVLRRVRLPPPDAELGALRRPRPRPARLRLADPPPAAGPRQQGQRRLLGRRRRRLRCAAAGRPGAHVPGAGRGRTLRRGAVHAARSAAAARQEPGGLAGDVLA